MLRNRLHYLASKDNVTNKRFTSEKYSYILILIVCTKGFSQKPSMRTLLRHHYSMTFNQG